VALISREYQPLLSTADAPDMPRGGIARAMSMHAHALVAAGVEQVHVITVTPEAEPRSFRDGEVFVHRLPDPRILLPPDMPYATLGIWSHRVAVKYDQLDAQIGFDVVEAPDYHGEVLHVVPRPGTPLVISLHCLTAIGAREQIREWSAGERAWDALELLSVSRADRVIAPTQLVLDETRALLGEELPPASLIPLPFDPARFPARERPTAGPEKLTLTFVGRIERLKAPDLALRIADAVRARGVPVKLQMIGRPNGPFADTVVRPLCESLASLEVEWTGELSEAEVAARLRASDCAVLPSRFENFHMAAIEALCSGVPVITTDRSGLTSWFSREDGFLALPVHDDDAYVNAAAEALTDREWLLHSGAAAAARVRELLDPVTVARRVLAAYDETREAIVGGRSQRTAMLPPTGFVRPPTLHDQALRAVEQARWTDARELAVGGLKADGAVSRLNDLAVILAQSADLEAAKAVLSACLVIRPDDEDALVNLEAIEQLSAVAAQAA
jgi:glycosyltransferase involved in cell wall biosynthesis